MTGFPPVQTPAWPVSVCVHALQSLHADPSSFAGFGQVPIAVLHASTMLFRSEAVQTTGFPPVQTPAWQVSVCVHALPSLHADPSALAGFEQDPVAVSNFPAVCR